MKRKQVIFFVVLSVTMSMVAGCTGKQSSAPTSAPVETEQTKQTEHQEGDGEQSHQSEATYVIKMGNVVAPTHPYSLGNLKFKELLEEKTEGIATADLFHSGQLGAERDLVEGLQLGTLEMATCSAAPLASFTDDFLVFDLPFLFASAERARETADSELCQGFLDNLESQGIKGLCYFENGFRATTNSKRPITAPDDCKGIKIRTMENSMHMAIWQALGADPTPMAWTEVFTALQQGAIDAQENPLAMVETSKLYEVQTYLSLTNHVYNPAPFLMSLDYYNSLPTEIQTAVVEAANEAKYYQRTVNDELEEELLKTLPEKGMQINEVDIAPFQEALAPVYEQFVGEGEGQVRPEVLEAVRAMQ